MPSSTSSSNSIYSHHRAPQKNWSVIWTLTILCSLAVVGVAESFWRSRGHVPYVVDSPALWSYHRSRIYTGGKKHVVLLGASRMHLGFSTDQFRTEFPNYELTQLAIDAKAPISTLLDLGADEKFGGLVICSVVVSGLQQGNWYSQIEYSDFYHEQFNFVKKNESQINVWLNSRLVVIVPDLKLDKIAHAILAGDALPTPSYIRMNADRSRPADYSLIDLKKHRAGRITKVIKSTASIAVAPEAWIESFQTVENAIQNIQRRGGKVVLVRFPAANEHWEIDELKYPRAEYWDQMAAATSAETIHFADYPELSRFELPDTVHLDYRDAPAFTSSLLEILVQRGILKREE